jgi:hypothetical protein
MNPFTITDEDVRDLGAAMERRFGSRIRSKVDSRLMRVIGWLLQLKGIVQADRFATDCTTTIARTIYTPYALGDPTVDLFGQVCTLAHEHQHVVDRGWRMYLGYLCNRRTRAWYEARAYAVGCEVEMAGGWAVDVDAIVRRVDVYGFDEAALGVFARELRTAWNVIREEGPISEVGRWTVGWLKQRESDKLTKEVGDV